MFNWSKDEKPKRSNRSGDKKLSQFGLFDIPDDVSGLDDFNNVNDDNDDDLEAELAALTTGGGSKPKTTPPHKPKLPPDNLDRLVTESMRDIPSDDDDDDEDIDENDPVYLNELAELTGETHIAPIAEETVVKDAVEDDLETLLNNRLKMYQEAERNATSAGETSRARRLGRGIKTLSGLIKSVKGGKVIDRGEIPPEVAVTVTKREPPPESTDSSSHVVIDGNATDSDKSVTLELLNERKKQYKLAALKAKKNNDNQLAIQYIKVAKQFDVVIEAVENDQPVDLNAMPGPPPDQITQSVKEECEKQTSSTDRPVVETVNTIEQEEVEVEEEEQGAVALITANSIGEALQQRLDVYKSEEAKAKEAGNASKARRMGRIVKQFESAIKAHSAGKSVAFDELPTPPGFAPIPTNESVVAPAAPPPVEKPVEQHVETPTPPKRGTTRKSGSQSSTTHNERQLQVLLQRQKEFKLAALNAKQNGDIEQAKEYIRMAKGMERLIEAAESGLPVDMNSIPVPASARSQLEDGYDFVSAAECNDDDSEIADIMARLEDQLTKQLKMCFNTRDHLKAIGDVAGMNRFEHLALQVTHDLDVVRVARRDIGGDPPKFHYEQKHFSVVKCCTDLNDDELELSVLRGINYKCTNPDDIDTYVKFDFPFPQEETFKERTGVVKNTNNPEYNAVFKIPIQRNVRACQRVFKRHGVKFEIYSKGCLLNDWCCLFNCCSGFFRSDTLLGTVLVKLQPLETNVEIHDSFNLMDGRKSVGGKLEVRLRIRNPIVTRQIEELSERWLIIDT